MSTNKYMPYILGFGLAILPIQRIYTVAVLGLAIVILVSMWTTYIHWREGIKLPFGIVVPVALLALLAIIIPGSTLYAKMYIIAMCCVLLAARVLGPKLLIPVGIGAIIGSLSVIATSIMSDFQRSGGVYHLVNYNQATGVILLGTVMWRNKYQWILLPIAITGALFTGADEAFVIIAVLGLAIMIRKDWSKKIIPTAVVLIVPIVFLLIPSNPVKNLWATIPATFRTITHQEITSGQQYEVSNDLNNRWKVIEDAITNGITFWGHGYQPDNVKQTTIHNVPIRVWYELGYLGLLAWLFLVNAGIIMTTWKYAFVVVVGASLFDHFMWTQLTPYFFALLGLSSYYPNTNDRIFS